jgi:hypothetical protein
MADPQSTGSAMLAAAAKSATSGGAVAAVVAFDPVTMAVGLIAALIALLHTVPPEGQQRAPLMVFVLVASSSFLAGALVPVVVVAGLNYYPWLLNAGTGGMSYAAAAIIGAAPHLAAPIWRAWRASKGGA